MIPDVTPNEAAEEPLPEPPDTIQWEAYEYIKRNCSTGWYFMIGAVALAFIILGILADNYLFVAFFLITAGLLVFYWKREPRRVVFALTPNHLLTGNKPLEYSRLKSFYLLDSDGEKELILETDNMLNRYLSIQVSDDLVEDIDPPRASPWYFAKSDLASYFQHFARCATRLAKCWGLYNPFASRPSEN